MSVYIKICDFYYIAGAKLDFCASSKKLDLFQILFRMTQIPIWETVYIGSRENIQWGPKV